MTAPTMSASISPFDDRDFGLSSSTELIRIAYAERFVDFNRRLRPVQRVEVNSLHAFVHELTALFRRPMYSDALDVLGVRARSLERSEKRCGEIGSCSKLRHAFQSRERCHRHDSRKDGNVDSLQSTSLLPIKKTPVVEEHLAADPVHAFIHLALEVVHLCQRVGGFRMSLGKPRRADRKSTGVGMHSRSIEFRDRPDQIRGVGKVLEMIA